MFAKKPMNFTQISRLIKRTVKREAKQLDYRQVYYRQIGLHLGSRELTHYKPLLEELQRDLLDTISQWYREQDQCSPPEIQMLAGGKKTGVSGSFAHSELPQDRLGGDHVLI